VPLVGMALLWFAYTLEWYGWLTYEFAYGVTNISTGPPINNGSISGASGSVTISQGPSLIDLIVPSRRNNVLAALAELSNKNQVNVGGTV